MTNLNSKKQLSDEARKTIIRKYENGKPTKVISNELEIPYQTINTIIRLYKNTGRILAIKKRNISRKKLNQDKILFIKEAIEDNASIRLLDLKKKLLEEKNIVVSKSTIDRSISSFNFSLKKVQFIPERRNIFENINLRYSYAENFVLIDDENLLFLDEFGANCSIRSSYGRAEIGISPRKKIRTIRSKNYSVSAAMSKKQLFFFEIIDSPYDGRLYLNFLERLLIKLQEKNLVNKIFILDNLPVHKMNIIREKIEEKGHSLLFLPPYSPQLNPIEELFSKWKNEIKRLEPTNLNELNNAILRGVSSITEENCIAYFSHMRHYVVKALLREDF